MANVREYRRPGRFFWNNMIILSFDIKLSKDKEKNMRDKIINISKQTQEYNKHTEIKFMTPEEYYRSRINGVFNGPFGDSTEWATYLEPNDIEFLKSMYPKFLANQGIYSEGTVIQIDSMNVLTKTIWEVKNEIANLKNS